MNPMEEEERRPIPTMQASRDVHSNSSSILLNTSCISPSAGPMGSCPQSVLNLIKVLECMWVFFGAQWLSGRVLDSRPKCHGLWASPTSLRCGPWARHIYPSLVLVQPRKTRPYITKRLLMGRKELLKSNLYVGFKSVPYTQDYRPNQS